MVADISNVPEGKLVIISSNDNDNGDVYIKIPNEFRYVTTLSGAQGIRGEQGAPGRDGADGEKGADGAPGRDGTDGITPHIDSTTGNWFIGDQNTGVKAQGADGQSGKDFKYEDFTPQQINALKVKGDPGANGADGVTPHIGMNGNWFIGDTDTNVKAHGNDAVTPIVRINSTTFEWEISTNGGTTYTSTGISAKGVKGDTGERGAKGETGDPFVIYRSYASVSDMNADSANIPENKFVIVSNGNQSDPDNGKLYIQTSNGLNYISTLSGATGIKGDKGDTGEQGPQGI